MFETCRLSQSGRTSCLCSAKGRRRFEIAARDPHVVADDTICVHNPTPGPLSSRNFRSRSFRNESIFGNQSELEPATVNHVHFLRSKLLLEECGLRFVRCRHHLCSGGSLRCCRNSLLSNYVWHLYKQYLGALSSGSGWHLQSVYRRAFLSDCCWHPRETYFGALAANHFWCHRFFYRETRFDTCRSHS